MTLVEAIESRRIRPGQTYLCRVRGVTVELRIVPDKVGVEARLDEDDIMLDSWFDLPEPVPVCVVKATPGPPPTPDRIEIPFDGDAPA